MSYNKINTVELNISQTDMTCPMWKYHNFICPCLLSLSRSLVSISRGSSISIDTSISGNSRDSGISGNSWDSSISCNSWDSSISCNSWDSGISCNSWDSSVSSNSGSSSISNRSSSIRNYGSSNRLNMDVRLSWNLNINIGLSRNLNMDIRLSKRICTGVCNGGIIRPSIKTSNRSYSSTNRLSSITNSNWSSSITSVSSI